MKKFIIIAVWCVLSIAAFPRGNYAASEFQGDELTLYLGEVHVLPVSNPTRIVIGDPSIADVVKVTKNDITITPKAAGATSMVLWDNFGEQAYRLKVYKENMEDIRRRVEKMLAKLEMPTVCAQAEEEEGRVVLTGMVKTQEDKDRIALALGAIKDKVVDLVVVKEEETGIEIAVQLLELSKDAAKTLGFSGPTSLEINDVGAAGHTTGATFHNLFKILQWQRNDFTWTVDALAEEGKARVLSRPRLLCQSGKSAELKVGGEKPVFTTSAATAVGGASTSVEYKEYGIMLKIKPTVTPERRIKVVLAVEVSEAIGALTIGNPGSPSAMAYPINKRTINTELYLDDNQTLAIGGLMKQKHEESTVKTAGLGDIPVLGALFRKKVTKDGGGSGEKGDMELFVTLTPTIVEAQMQPLSEGAKKILPTDVPDRRATSGKQMSDPMRRYSAVVQRRILDNFKYPASARNAGFQGTVMLTLHLSYAGELLDAAVKSSSGHKVLDEHALAVAKAISTYPPFPPTLDQEELWVEVPIVYTLE